MHVKRLNVSTCDREYWRPRPDSGSHVQYIYPLEAVCSIKATPSGNGRKIPLDTIPRLMSESRTLSLRRLAREYGVSHEAIRQTLRTFQQ